MTLEQRDKLIRYCGENGVGVNVHYIPMAELTLFKQKGYDIKDYPKTFEMYANEVSLPIYNNLTWEQLDIIVKTFTEAYNECVVK